MSTDASRYVRWYTELGMGDVGIVGGKNASLGEMITNLISKGVAVPPGFATTAQAFREFLSANKLDERINSTLSALDVTDSAALRATGERIRGWVLDATLPSQLCEQVLSAYHTLCEQDAEKARQAGNSVAASEPMTVAVRSSATAEDLPGASFAGQQETYLNVTGDESLLRTLKRVMASMYTDRAIAYRVHQGFQHSAVALSVGIQKMVRSDGASSGVLFTIDTESGFPGVCLVTSSYGLGELVVQGSVVPDEWLVYKPLLPSANGISQASSSRIPIVHRTLGSKATKMIYSTDRITAASTVTVDVRKAEREKFSLTDAEVLRLASFGATVEAHYGRPMDVEWAKDAVTGELYVVQARPETVHGSREAGAVVSTFHLLKAVHSAKVLVEGRAVGAKCATGKVRVILEAAHMAELRPGEILVTEITDPDWEPVMKLAGAIVTAQGGRTCHAAIVAREMGLPALVGAAGATAKLEDGQLVTVVCCEGDIGAVYEGAVSFEERKTDISKLPRPSRTKVSLILGHPAQAFSLARMPVRGVGLVRLEFVLNKLGIHPLAALNVDRLADADTAARIRARSLGYSSPKEAYVSALAQGVGCIAAAFYPEAVIVRLSDFKSNEYRGLLGGALYEPEEENPMLGWRGAARYHSSQFAPAFALECEAMRRVRGQMGLTNVELLIPFVRSVDELKQVLELLASEGLARGSGGEDTPAEVQAASNGKAVPGLKVHMMAELPVNCLSAAEFLAHVDGFSIGSNDLCQLTLGTDRDSGLVHAGDERDPAVKSLIAQAAMACAEAGKYSGICGQAPSDFPELAEWLVRSIRIGSISLNADVLLGTLGRIVEAEAPVGPPAEGTQMMTSKAAAAAGGFEAATLSG